MLRSDALHVIESLRKGIPPQYGINAYSTGNQKLLQGIKRFHLDTIAEQGLFRFISGSWGSGKTHFFRQLRELAFEDGLLVSTVELNVDSAALNKFETVFSSIVMQISTPESYRRKNDKVAQPFRLVIEESLHWLTRGGHFADEPITDAEIVRAVQALLEDHSIDIDFKKMIKAYWETFQRNNIDTGITEQTRDEILQWFACEGTLSTYKKKYGINKIIKKDNAKAMLQSLSGFVRLSGFKGLLILFDEAEQAYSLMRNAALKDAHNNLLSLINNIDNLNGIFLVYATTPDFYNDEKHGIVIYGALKSRIGSPSLQAPTALQTIWNIDANPIDLSDYQKTAVKIFDIYKNAYGDDDRFPTNDSIQEIVKEQKDKHSPYSEINFWRYIVKYCVQLFDDVVEGTERTPEERKQDVMQSLKEV